MGPFRAIDHGAGHLVCHTSNTDILLREAWDYACLVGRTVFIQDDRGVLWLMVRPDGTMEPFVYSSESNPLS